ncbi:MAG: hypothetical protein B6229_07125 [Spirochaetaceae bacterium 4572_7]|nr:MAG: hypothetical protein B6229_07125 [Spirochaetaceae bacterium 4572_7]
MVNLTIVIPIYNGFHNLPPLLKKLIPELENLNKKWEIIFVDDHSNDNSFNYLKERNKIDSRIKCIRLKNNSGQQNAVFCGLVHSLGEMIITMDDDLQHPIHIIRDLINKLNEGYDIVYAVNRSSDRPKSLSIGTWLNSLFFTLFLKKPQNVEIGSYRIMTRELVNNIKNIKNGFIYISAQIFNIVPRPKALSIFYIPDNERKKQQSRINLKSRFKLFKRLFLNYGPTKKITKEKGEPFLIERRL